jgi:hypothetical protein
MRDLIDLLDSVLNEAALQPAKLRPHYLENLINLISNGQPVPLAGDAQEKYGKTATFKKSQVSELKKLLNQYRDTKNVAGYMDIKNFPRLVTTDGIPLALTSIDKSSAIKGVEQDYNIGDIGEIALGVAAGARFFVSGDTADFNDFVSLANEMTVEETYTKTGKLGNSLKLLWSSPFVHPSGKADEVTVVVLAPGRSVREFINFMKSPDTLPAEVKGTILSALSYANSAKKIDQGIAKTAADPNTNMIEVTCDGISDQKGTKADLVMSIDGERINLISAKTGPSQLGQASGHDWNKQAEFFKTVFGVDVSPFADQWGETNEEHMKTLQGIWSSLVIPAVTRLTGGNSVQKEKQLVQNIANGLVRYSNNFNPQTGQSETIDIVKLITDPGSPGYELLRIDSKLADAMQRVDLVGEPTANGMGIQVVGLIDGQRGKTKDNLLFKSRSYYSPAGKVVRTIIEGGHLLDTLAATAPKQSVTTPATRPAVQKSQQTTDQATGGLIDVAGDKEPQSRLTGPGAKTARKPVQPKMTAEVLGREVRRR